MESTLQSTNEDLNLYESARQDEIERLYRIFALRIGGVRPRQLADYIQSHAISRFASDKFVGEFTSCLRASFELTEVLCEKSLAISKDMKNIPEGIWDDIIRQTTLIVTLWRRMDKALLGLARQHLTHESPNSADGMGLIKDSPFATPLFEFMESLNLFPGKKFLDQIEEWFEATESLFDKIDEAIEKRDKIHEAIEKAEKEHGKEDELEGGDQDW